MDFTQKMRIALIKLDYQKQMLADDLGMTRCTLCSRQKKGNWTKSEMFFISHILDMEIPRELNLSIKK